jgi:ketol-acid reductoisomerase
MRERISSTARFGDLTRGSRVIGDASRQEMRRILQEIRSGAFTAEFLKDRAAGRAIAKQLLDADREHPVERIGREIRGTAKPRSGDPSSPAT